jgi:glycosyltransferase involved in cell wall biosynthesis
MAESARSPVRLAILCHDSGGRVDGIRDYATQLVAGLRARGDVQVALLVRTGAAGWVHAEGADSGSAILMGLGRTVASPEAVVLQYNPFSYGRWGFAPYLPLEVWRMRRCPSRPTVALTVHETHVGVTDWRSALMGSWQRIQLLALRTLADLIITPTEAWAGPLRRSLPRRPVHHIPVGSSLPDMGRFRSAERRRLGMGEEAVGLAAFGTGHPSRLISSIEHAALAVARAGHSVVMLNLGAGTPSLRRLDGVIPMHTPSRLDPEPLARRIAAADIFLAPYVDGVSTRRTTVMAALQHGVPVVGTYGESTDAVLRNAAPALQLVPACDPRAFSEAAVALANDKDLRARASKAARELYRAAFDWPVVTEQLLEALSIHRRI